MSEPEVVVLVWRGGKYDRVPKVGIEIVRQLKEARGEEEGLPALYALDENHKVVIWPKPTKEVEVTIISGDKHYGTDQNQLAMLHGIRGVE